MIIKEAVLIKLILLLAFEGAFANIILQNGLSSAIGYILTFTLNCPKQGPYCVMYRDGTLHNVLTFELLVVVSAAIAVLGFWRASTLHHHHQLTHVPLPSSASGTVEVAEAESNLLLEDEIDGSLLN